MKLLLPLAFLFLLTSSSSPTDCSHLKEGTFSYTIFGSEIQVYRRGNTQVEIYPLLDAAVMYKVKWTSDCQHLLYGAKTIKGEDPFGDMADDTTIVDIVKVTDEYYKVVSSKPGKKMKYRQKIEIVDLTPPEELTNKSQ